MRGEPSIRNLTQDVMFQAHVSWRQNLECQSFAFTLLERLAQSIALGTFQAELVQIDAGLFADLDDPETRVEVKRQAIGTNLIEGGASTVFVGKFDEAPNQFRPFLATSHRIEQCNPASAALGIHKEGISRTGKQK